MSYVPVLKKIYTEQVAPELVKLHGYKNKHQVPKLVKINLNTGIDADADKNQIADIARDMAALAGQKPLLNKTKRAIANFKLKPNQTTGCSVTLRGPAMWEFLYRLLSVALPSIRDFRGVPSKLDGQGNYSLGVTDFSIFPEITLENVKKSMGLDVTIVTTAHTDDEGRDLLRLLGMPFRRIEPQPVQQKSNAA
ncbi:MAG: 50S ribosomal protein L5 [Opitutia bacterium]|nr:50S ribosomal protein L5 [Opitutaceae bacterium]PHX73484.1 MAG: 50S ribosomal protein L5 [Opitutae bacterium]